VRVAVTGVGLCTALGTRADQVRQALDAGRTAVRTPDDPRGSLPLPGVAEVEVDVRPFLKRRKDRKLLPRAAELAIPAARDALGELPGARVGCFLGVGREPPEDATERAILAAERDGELDPVRLGQHGLPLYPPLASLRTLPNLVLAHVAIQLDLTGEGASVAGQGAAGLAAIVRACQAVHEGRCRVALAGGADSLVHAALARDHVRAGRTTPVGEAAAWIRLEDPEHARARGARVQAMITAGRVRIGPQQPTVVAHHHGLGECGAADGAVALVLALSRGDAGTLSIAEVAGPSVEIRWGLFGEPSP